MPCSRAYASARAASRLATAAISTPSASRAPARTSRLIRAVERMPQRVAAIGRGYARRVATRGRSFWAPGRVNLIGELPAETINLRSEGYDHAARAAADGHAGQGAGWGRYVSAVAVELDLLGRPPVGIEGTVSSPIPFGAGLSSS